jgi:hypothetical protein
MICALLVLGFCAAAFSIGATSAPTAEDGALGIFVEWSRYSDQDSQAVRSN